MRGETYAHGNVLRMGGSSGNKTEEENEYDP